MKSFIKLTVFIAAFGLAMAFVGCSNGSDGASAFALVGGGSGGTGTNNPGGGTTQTDGGTSSPTTETPTTPTNPTTPTETSTTQPKYEWVFIGYEIKTENNNIDSVTTVDYNYSYYNSSYDRKLTWTSKTVTSVTTNGSKVTNTMSEIKNDVIYFLTGDVINSTSKAYWKVDDDWELRSESSNEYYKYDLLTKKLRSKTYPYTTNGVSFAGSETEIDNTIELINNTNDKEVYKVSSSNKYDIYEYNNGVIQKITNYNDGKKETEAFYTRPNNSVLISNLPKYTTYEFKYYDTNGNLTITLSSVIESVDYTEDQIVITTREERIPQNGSISRRTDTYKKMHIPFSK